MKTTKRYTLSGMVSDTHVDAVEVTEPSQAQAQYVPGLQTITVTTGRGSIELPWDAHPMIKVGTPVVFTIEVST